MRISLIAMLVAVVSSATLSGQGFSGKLGAKTTIVLQRKLPAAVTLRGNTFKVIAVASRPTDNVQKVAADKLQSTVETDLIRFNSALQIEEAKPDNIISLRVMNTNVIVTPEYTTSLTGKTKGQQQQSGVKVNGALTIAYQVKTRAGASVDARTIDVKFAHEYNNVSNAVAGTKKILGKLPLVGKKHSTAEEEDSDEPHTNEDVLQILCKRATERITARLVNTNERLEVLLARGTPFDENNRYAEAGQWSKFVENLETMTPLASPEDDSYRLYNIGVGDEAQGYKAETPDSARSYFERAVIQYRKAGESNPHEKYFIEPVNRIEVALEHYKKLTTAAPKKGK